MPAPTFDAATPYNGVNLNTSFTFNHTCGATAKYLKVGISTNQVLPAAITGVTYNGVAMTQGSTTQASGDGFSKISYWYLVNPHTGSSDAIVATFDLVSSPNQAASCSAVSYAGVDTSTPHGTFHPQTGTSNSPSNTVASATGELVVDVLGGSDTSISTCGNTQRVATSAGSPDSFGGASEAAGAATVAMSWTLGSSQGWASIGVSLKPTAGGGGSTTTKSVDETLTVLDEGFSRRFVVTAEDGSTVDMTDTIGQRLTRGRVTADTVALLDSINRALTRGRVTSDNIALLDSIIDWIRRTRLASDTITLADSMVIFYRRVRVSQDIITLIDTIISTALAGIRIKIVGETIDIIDETIRYKRVTRLVQDTLNAIDSLVDFILRSRTSSDTFALSDSTLQYLRRTRGVFDSVDVVDGALMVRWSRKFLSETLGVADELIPTLIPFVSYSYDVRMRVGMDEIMRLGIDNLMRLGMDEVARLGVH